jgi:hypothetical protein
MTNRNERIMVDKIDRRRERASEREHRTARQKVLEARADALIACEVQELPEDDRADFTRFLSAAVRRHLVTLYDAPGAAAILARDAYEAGRDILPRKVAVARAEQLFTKAANDRSADQ